MKRSKEICLKLPSMLTTVPKVVLDLAELGYSRTNDYITRYEPPIRYDSLLKGDYLLMYITIYNEEMYTNPIVREILLEYLI
jgi:hypothetical protein